jgi:hypothetical protein
MSRKRKARLRARCSTAAWNSPSLTVGAGLRTSTPHARRLGCERLEDRRLLAVVTVDLLDDSTDLGDGRTSLREATFATNTVPGADEIRFDAALFADGAKTILLTQGELVVTDSLTITGPGAELLTIDASGKDPTPDVNNGDGSRVFNITIDHGAWQYAAILAGMTLTGGDSSSSGGAVASNHTLALRHLVLVDNAAEFSGGAIFVALGAQETITLEMCQIARNRATSGHGGGISLSLIDGATAHLVEAHFELNSADGAGGGLYVTNQGAGAVTILESSLTSNDGGGAHLSSSAGGNVTVLNTEFLSNVDSGTVGGGASIALTAGGSVTLSGNRFSKNSTKGTTANGGGLHLRAHGGSVSLSNNEFAENTTSGTSASGAGAYMVHTATGTVTLSSNSFIKNSTRGNSATGGGVFLTAQSGAVALLDNVFTENATDGTSGEGGGADVRMSGQGSIAVHSNQFTNNHSDGTGAGGGGAFVLHSGVGFLGVTDNQFVDNSAVGTGGYGGGLAVIKSGTGDATISNNLIDGNSMAGTSVVGIGMYALAGAGSSVLISSNAVYDNVEANERSATAGIAVDIAVRGAARVENNDVRGNYVGIRASSFGWVEISSNTVVENDFAGLQLSVGSVSGVGRIADNVVSRNATGISASIMTTAPRNGSGTGGQIDVEDNLVEGNTETGMRLVARFGGVIHSQRNTIRGNQSQGAGGGLALNASSGGSVIVRDSEISSNVSQYGLGGGVYAVCSGGGVISVERSTISGNRSILGNVDGTAGGAYLRNDGGTLTFDQCTISANYAAMFGGGVAIRSEVPGGVAIRRSTLTENVADADSDGGGAGGGLYVFRGSVEIDHSIIAGNTDLSGMAPELTFDPTAVAVDGITARYSIVADNLGSPFSEAPVDSPDGNGNLIGGSVHGVIDAMLGPLADNGGPTLTHALLPGSPAIDAGDASLVAGVGATPAFDQRGAPFSRVVGTRIDMGAVEQTGVPLVADTLVDESDGDYARGDVSLREAIELANAQVGADVIVFDPKLFAAGSGTILLTHGQLALTDSLTITGPGAELLTIDASGNDPTPEVKNGDGSRIFEALRTAATIIQGIEIRGLTLTGGDVAGNGGAILSNASSLVLVMAKVTGNATTVDGGGIWAINATVHESLITENSATRHGGGLVAGEVLTVVRSAIVGNQAGRGGGGIYIRGGTLDVQESSVYDNRSTTSGGGISAISSAITVSRSSLHRNQNGGLSASGSSLLMEGCQVFENFGAFGGGLYVGGEAESIAILNTMIRDNRTTLRGGGLRISAHGSGSATISGCEITGNSTTVAGAFGGGVFAFAASQSAIVFKNCTISSNSSAGAGGGFYCTSVDRMVLENCTVANNVASGPGGAMYLIAGSLVVQNSIVADNIAADLSDDIHALVDASIQMRFSILGDNHGTTLLESSMVSPDANGNLIGGPVHGVIDPLLGPLADNGGPTLTHALLPGSPAIGAGDPALLPGSNGVPEFDQRGAPFTRVAGATIDMGAFEFQAVGGALNADFDLNGQVDGHDFLAWQRNLGRASGATIRHGDATGDGDVDGNDLGVWRERFGAEGSGFGVQGSGAEGEETGDGGRETGHGVRWLAFSRDAEAAERSAGAGVRREGSGFGVQVKGSGFVVQGSGGSGERSTRRGGWHTEARRAGEFVRDPFRVSAALARRGGADLRSERLDYVGEFLRNSHSRFGETRQQFEDAWDKALEEFGASVDDLL